MRKVYGKIIMNYDKDNYVKLKGILVCRPKIIFDKNINCKIVYFIIAVDRTNSTFYPQGYNVDEFNYFYCIMSEKLFSVDKLHLVAEKFKRLDQIEIEGCLDNRINDKLKQFYISQQIKFRALNTFVSTICVYTMKHYVPKNSLGHKKRLSKQERELRENIEQTYGGDARFKLSDNADKKNIYGFEKDDDLPDY